MNAVLPQAVTVTIAETDTVVPAGQTYASLQAVLTDSSAVPQTATAVSTAPGIYQAKFSTVIPGPGNVVLTALDTNGASIGTVITLPYDTSTLPQTYPQATGITVTSP